LRVLFAVRDIAATADEFDRPMSLRARLQNSHEVRAIDHSLLLDRVSEIAYLSTYVILNAPPWCLTKTNLFAEDRRDGRLSRPSWLVTYLDRLPVRRRSPIQVLTGTDVD